MQRYKDGFFFSREFIGEQSWNGSERKCLFANVGGGQFLDVARPLGADFAEQLDPYVREKYIELWDAATSSVSEDY